jgi:hypothetical protein
LEYSWNRPDRPIATKDFDNRDIDAYTRREGRR